MTKRQILSLKPGTQEFINAICFAMGWKKEFNKLDSNIWHWLDHKGEFDGKVSYDEPFDPTTKIDDAWRVIEFMKDSKWSGFSLYSVLEEEENNWLASFSCCYGPCKHHKWNQDHQSHGAMFEAKTAPEAICKAALFAVNGIKPSCQE
jgi:hypothetical protein